MSEECRTLFMRGRYFIETGTAQTFSSWVKLIDKITQNTPPYVIDRIAHLIGLEKREQATLLWMKVCEAANRSTSILMKEILYTLLHIIISGMAIYAFIDAILR